MCDSLSGVVGRRYSVSACPLSRPSRCANSVRSTTNGNAQTSGANKTVNGYLIFILYSVALLARALSSLYEKLAVLNGCPPFIQLFAL